jgi:sterol desaturase/sphingolipid hydroxylase (fatty acid hydroxylase superfamily)
MMAPAWEASRDQRARSLERRIDVDAMMSRNHTASLVAAVLSLAVIPAVWLFAFGAIPAHAIVVKDAAGGRMGPWVFTWALVWVATIAALVVAYLCYSSNDDSSL